MAHPFNGPRHRTVASNTVISGVMLAFLIGITVWVDRTGDPPDYLVGLLGTAAATFFGAIAGDKAKKDADVERTAKRAEAKVDTLVEVAKQEHPGVLEHEVERESAEEGRAEAERGRELAEEKRADNHRRREGDAP